MKQKTFDSIAYRAMKNQTRRFAGRELNVDAIPDETTILKLRRFLEKHALAPKVLETANAHPATRGTQMRAGTLVDATIIHAPSSTKSSTGTCDSEMHQTTRTPANTADITLINQQLTGEEKTLHADAGYYGAEK